MWENTKNSIIIPKSFTVAGSNYDVIKVNSEKEIKCLGDFTPLLHRIRIVSNYLDDEDNSIKEMPNDEYLKTYLHELGHAFNYYYNDGSSEEFANAFANFFYEYLISKK